MATLYTTDGKQHEVKPRNGTDFQLDELYKLIGCEVIEVVAVEGDRLLIIDEEGKLKARPMNTQATILADLCGDYIVGNALLVNGEEFL